MLDSEWTFSHVQQPVVSATIKTEFWELNTTTYTSANLSVLANSVLTLMCVAHYPIAWKANTDSGKVRTVLFDQAPSNRRPCQG